MTEPPDVRWQMAHVLFTPAIEQPTSNEMLNKQCRLIWVHEDDWRRYCDWQFEQRQAARAAARSKTS